jgi:hypothetical protein
MAEEKQWFSGFTNLPFDVPTKADLEDDDPRTKVVVNYKGWNFKMFDMHDADQVKAYEKLRSELVEMLRLNKGKIAKDCAQLLATKSGQKLYYILEWAEFDAKIVTAEELVKDKDEQSK